MLGEWTDELENTEHVDNCFGHEDGHSTALCPCELRNGPRLGVTRFNWRDYFDSYGILDDPDDYAIGLGGGGGGGGGTGSPKHENNLIGKEQTLNPATSKNILNGNKQGVRSDVDSDNLEEENQELDFVLSIVPIGIAKTQILVEARIEVIDGMIVEGYFTYVTADGKTKKAKFNKDYKPNTTKGRGKNKFMGSRKTLGAMKSFRWVGSALGLISLVSIVNEIITAEPGTDLTGYWLDLVHCGIGFMGPIGAIYSSSYFLLKLRPDSRIDPFWEFRLLKP